MNVTAMNIALIGRRITLSGAVWRIALIAILSLTFLPFVFMVITSLKDTNQFFHSFWMPVLPLRIENYIYAFGDMKVYLLNSILITALSVSGIVTFASLAGFVFARCDFPGREMFYYNIIAMMMIPGVLMLIPSFLWVKRLGLLDTYSVMLLPYIASGQILGIYLLRTFFSEIEEDLFEASQVDGAGLLRQFWHVGLPLAKPVLGVVAIVSALSVWNNFLWPLVTTSSDDVMVLTVGILRYNGKVGNQYGRMFAGYAISSIPLCILFLFCTRLFMKGIMSGALKA